MRWSLRIARIAGIDVRIHATFVLLLVWIGLIEYFARRDARAAAVGVFFMIAVFVTVVLHEFGHALVARRYGVKTPEITLLPIGGVARLERMPENPRQELWIALAGPVVSLAVALVIYAVLQIAGGLDTSLVPHPIAGPFLVGTFFAQLMWTNLLIAGFNLLPAFPMDGGRILRALLATRMDYIRATRIAARMGQGLALVFGLVGLFFNPFLLFIALFVWMGATQEGAEVQFRAGLDGVPVRSAMMTDVQTIAPDAPLSRAVELVLAGAQQDFPVVLGDKVVGMLTRDRMLRALAENGASQPVFTAMDEHFEVADPGEMLSDVVGRLSACDCHTLPVVREDRIVGLLTSENVTEFLLIQSAISGTGRSRGAPPGARSSAAAGMAAGLCLVLALAVGLMACRSTRDEGHGSTLAPSSGNGPAVVAMPPAPPPIPGGAPDIPTLVANVRPVVVNVTVEQTVPQRPSAMEFDFPFDFFDFPWGPRRERGQGEGGQRRPPRREETQRRQARGSGFIIDAAGHVVTNAHVVEGARAVKVRLLDERELEAKVIGRDRHLDLAVLELGGVKELPAPLPVAALGSSEALTVGEAVVAIGNPFGLGHTVTFGIVSAKSRAIGAGPYDDFIQTDAAINPGNSGGPLFDMKGQVVGINTAITAQGSGIGFAIPIDEMKEVLPQLLTTGHVQRGRIGVVVQAIDWTLAQAFGLDRPAGALVVEVEKGSPADTAGIKERDVIVAVDGKKIESWHELPRYVARHMPGTRVKLDVLRDKQTKSIEVTLARLEDDETAQKKEEDSSPQSTKAPSLGIEVADAPGGGALVNRIAVGTPADTVLEVGDVILELNGKTVSNAREFQQLVRATTKKGPLLLKIWRAGRSRYVAIEPK